MSTSKSFSGQDLADLTGVEGITFRRYIRSDGTRVGRGKKYAFDADTAKLLIQGFLTGKSGTVEVTDEETGETTSENVKQLTEDQAKEIAEALINGELAEETEDAEDEDSTEDDNTEEAPAAEEKTIEEELAELTEEDNDSENDEDAA